MGCAQPDFCMPYDPYNPYGNFCPVYCTEEEQLCPGGEGMPDFCMPIDAKSPCPQFCPVNCGQNEMYCPGGFDANQCEMPGWCNPYDVTALCQHEYPVMKTFCVRQMDFANKFVQCM